MNSAVKRCMINESDDSLGIFVHSESWSRTDTIIADKIGFPEVWIDLLLKGFDFNLEIIDCSAGGCIGIRTMELE